MRRRLAPRGPLRLIAALCAALGFLAGAVPGHADELDVAFRQADMPMGELSTAFALGPVSIAAHHREYLSYLNSAYQGGEDVAADPLIRSSRIDSGGLLEIGSGVEFPLELAVGLDEWDSGLRDLRLTARSGLRLPGFSLNHSLTSTTSFAADSSESRHSAGRLALGFDFLGGVQEGVLEYDVEPIGQVTAFSLSSDWRFADGAAASVSLSHRPLEAISEIHLGFQEAVGPFRITSDFSTDSLGAYAVGVGFALDLAPSPEPASWSLASLLAATRAEIQ